MRCVELADALRWLLLRSASDESILLRLRRLAPKVLHQPLGVLACLAGAELLVPTVLVPDLKDTLLTTQRPQIARTQWRSWQRFNFSHLFFFHFIAIV